MRPIRVSGSFGMNSCRRILPSRKGERLTALCLDAHAVSSSRRSDGMPLLLRRTRSGSLQSSRRIRERLDRYPAAQKDDSVATEADARTKFLALYQAAARRKLPPDEVLFAEPLRPVRREAEMRHP